MPNHFRAPTQHGELLLAPEGSLAELVRANEARLVAGQLWGRALAEVREEARAEVYPLATRYTSDLIGPESGGGIRPAAVSGPLSPVSDFQPTGGHVAGERVGGLRLSRLPPLPGPLPPSGVLSESNADCGGEGAETTLPSQHWIIGGHQPELFHPGVWVKNAVVAGLAAQLGGVGLNLIVDNDVCAGSSVRVPCRPNSAGMMSLDWDVPRPQSPWEERPQPDVELFTSFGERCREQLRPWGMEPLAAGQDWGASPERGVVDRLVQLRVRFERSVGVRNLELKVSDLAETLCFRRFLIGVLSDAEALRAAYNTALTDYRSLHHIRSRSHPVPALERAAEGVETPFWVWRAGETQRSRLFVQATGPGTLRLHDGRREIGTISATSEATALTQLQDLRSQGWKIRPRALTLTLFCRICLGSVFVHGIGGAKYDEMTDALMQRWLGLTPPQIIVATATLRLFERFAGPPLEPEIARLQQELRLIRWNPELVQAGIDNSASTAALRAEKSALLYSSVIDRATRHARLQSLNTALRAELIEYEQQLRHALQHLFVAVPHQQSLRSREFAANLYPREAMQDIFQRAMDFVRGY